MSGPVQCQPSEVGTRIESILQSVVALFIRICSVCYPNHARVRPSSIPEQSRQSSQERPDLEMLVAEGAAWVEEVGLKVD